MNVLNKRSNIRAIRYRRHSVATTEQRKEVAATPVVGKMSLVSLEIGKISNNANNNECFNL